MLPQLLDLSYSFLNSQSFSLVLYKFCFISFSLEELISTIYSVDLGLVKLSFSGVNPFLPSSILQHELQSFFIREVFTDPHLLFALSGNFLTINLPQTVVTSSLLESSSYAFAVQLFYSSLCYSSSFMSESSISVTEYTNLSDQLHFLSYCY